MSEKPGNRFDPEKVEWSGEPTHPSYSTAPGPDSAGNISMELGPGYQVVPAYAYTELYEVAEAMADELSARCSCPCRMPKDERCEACRLTDAYREETEG